MFVLVGGANSVLFIARKKERFKKKKRIISADCRWYFTTSCTNFFQSPICNAAITCYYLLCLVVHLALAFWLVINNPFPHYTLTHTHPVTTHPSLLFSIITMFHTSVHHLLWLDINKPFYYFTRVSSSFIPSFKMRNRDSFLSKTSFSVLSSKIFPIIQLPTSSIYTRHAAVDR